MTGLQRTHPRGLSPRDRGKTPTSALLSAVVFSCDETIIELVAHALDDGWRLVRCPEPSQARNMPIKPGVKIVVVDDQAIEVGTRGWLLDRVHKVAPDALVAYIAANHSPDVERFALSHNVSHYDSQPIEPQRILRILRSFMGAVR